MNPRTTRRASMRPPGTAKAKPAGDSGSASHRGRWSVPTPGGSASSVSTPPCRRRTPSPAPSGALSLEGGEAAEETAVHFWPLPRHWSYPIGRFMVGRGLDLLVIFSACHGPLLLMGQRHDLEAAAMAIRRKSVIGLNLLCTEGSRAIRTEFVRAAAQLGLTSCFSWGTSINFTASCFILLVTKQLLTQLAQLVSSIDSNKDMKKNEMENVEGIMISLGASTTQ
jgi:hypothetical protein